MEGLKRGPGERTIEITILLWYYVIGISNLHLDIHSWLIIRCFMLYGLFYYGLLLLAYQIYGWTFTDELVR